MNGTVPARLVQEMLRGSYEQMVADTSQLISESYARFGVDGPDEVHVVATFPKHAVVTTDEGRFFRVSFQDLENGGRSVVQAESMDVPVLFSRDDQIKFMRSAANEAVEALMAGDFEASRTRVRELVMSAEILTGPDPVMEMKSALEGLFDGERPWRRVYAENSNGIHRFLWGASGVTYRDAPKPKYQGIYMSEMENPDGYNEALQADLSVLAERLSGLWKVVEENYGPYAEQDGGFYPLAIAGVNENFQHFAGDFADELRQVCRLVESASQDDDPSTVVVRAVLYDSVARQYPMIEMAARLVRRTSTELSK